MNHWRLTGAKTIYNWAAVTILSFPIPLKLKPKTLNELKGAHNIYQCPIDWKEVQKISLCPSECLNHLKFLLELILLFILLFAWEWQKVWLKSHVGIKEQLGRENSRCMSDVLSAFPDQFSHLLFRGKAIGFGSNVIMTLLIFRGCIWLNWKYKVLPLRSQPFLRVNRAVSLMFPSSMEDDWRWHNTYYDFRLAWWSGRKFPQRPNLLPLNRLFSLDYQ